MCRPHIHDKGRNSEWVPPLFYMTHPSALLHSAPRSECSRTLPGLCCNMPETPAEEWRRRLLKSGFNKSAYLVIFLYHNVHVCSSLFPFKATFQHLRPGLNVRSWDQAINESLQNKQHARQESNTYSLQWCQVKGQMSHSIQKCLCYETCDLHSSLKQHLCHAPVTQHHLCLLITQNKVTNTTQRWLSPRYWRTYTCTHTHTQALLGCVKREKPTTPS